MSHQLTRSFSSRLAKEEGREKCMEAPNRAIRTESLRKIVRERCTAYGKSEKKLQCTVEWRHGTSFVTSVAIYSDDVAETEADCPPPSTVPLRHFDDVELRDKVISVR